MTLTGTITPDQSGPGSNGDEGALHIPQIKPHYQMQFSVIPRTNLWGRSLNSYSQHILSPVDKTVVFLQF